MIEYNAQRTITVLYKCFWYHGDKIVGDWSSKKTPEAEMCLEIKRVKLFKICSMKKTIDKLVL